MSLEGVWTAEVYGPFGWESIGVLVLEKGRIIGGGNRHYSSGTYTEEGDRFTASIDVHYYGPPRAMFGESVEEFTSELSGTRHDEVIEGSMTRADRPKYDLQVRLTRRMDVPAHS